MKTLLPLSFLLPFPGASAPALQGAEPLPSTVQVQGDASRSLRVIDLRDFLKADAEILDSSTGIYTAAGSKPDPWRDVSPAVPMEPARAKAVASTTGARASDPAAIAARAAAVQEILQLWIRPPLVRERDLLQVTSDGTLIANLTAGGHAWLDRFLAVQREVKCLVDTKFHIIRAPHNSFDRFLSSGDSGFLSSDEAEKLLETAGKGGGYEIVSAPRLVIRCRQGGFISSRDRLAYVKEWRVETVEPGHQEIAVPEIGTAEDGWAIDMRGVLLDETHFGLELLLTLSKVKQPIETRKVHLAMAGGREVEVASPETTTVRLQTQITLEPGRYALFRGPASDRDRDVAVLVQVDRRDSPPPAPETTITTAPRSKDPEKH